MLEIIDLFFSSHPVLGSLLSGLVASFFTIASKEFVKIYSESRQKKTKKLEHNRKKLFNKIYAPIHDRVYLEIWHRDGDCSRLKHEDVEEIMAILEKNKKYVSGELEIFYNSFMDWLEQEMVGCANGDYPKEKTEKFHDYIFKEYNELKKEFYNIEK